MAKADLKTKKNNHSVTDYLNTLDPKQKADSFLLRDMMQSITSAPAKMWGDSIVGFGGIHLKYESGRELDWFKIGFAPRKSKISLYVLTQTNKIQEKLLEKLGPHHRGKSCLYIKRLESIDTEVLAEICILGSGYDTGLASSSTE